MTLGSRRSLPDTIVCLPINEWAGLPVNSHHLMREAASRGYRVLYVDPIGLRRPTLARKDVAKLRRRIRHLTAPLVAVERGIWRLAPVGIPLQDSNLGLSLNTRLLPPQIRLALRRLEASRILLWVYPPQLVTLRSAIPCELVIYHRTDDYVSLPGMNAELLRACETQAVKAADLCIAPARRYLDGPLSKARNALWVPNAVDHRMFDRSRIGADPLAHVSHPRLLMMGTFDEWVDVDLLRNVMSTRPAWNLVLAGNPKISLERLLALENVHFVGRVPYEKLPTLVWHCDVGLIPFRIGPVAADATPSKLYQYLAGGLPVLCTPFLDPELFDGYVTVASDAPGGFTAAIEDLLRADSPAERRKRQAFVREHTWAARFDAIEHELERLSSRYAS
jgi:glycosyltransferase involved in cell wall biosynthesis